MKTKTLLLTVMAGAAIAWTSAASAQYKPTGADGITASPKVRQHLDERLASARAATLVPLGGTAVNLTSFKKEPIAASPKLHAQLTERKAIGMGSSKNDPNLLERPKDGIAASPRIREQMGEHIAPATDVAPRH